MNLINNEYENIVCILTEEDSYNTVFLFSEGENIKEGKVILKLANYEQEGNY